MTEKITPLQGDSLNNVISDAMKIERGLILVNVATGHGKTFSSSAAIADAKKTGDCYKKIFFLASQKKQLPVKELNNMLGSENYIVCRTNADELISKFDLEGVPERFSSYIPHNLSTLIDKYRCNKSTSTYNEIREASQLFTSKLAALGAYIGRYNPDEMEWIIDMFPVEIMENYSVLLMTIDKMLCWIKRLSNDSVDLRFSDILFKSIIIIDEIDGAKEVIQKALIRQAVNEKGVCSPENFIAIIEKCSRAMYKTPLKMEIDKRLEEFRMFVESNPCEGTKTWVFYSVGTYLKVNGLVTDELREYARTVNTHIQGIIPLIDRKEDFPFLAVGSYIEVTSELNSYSKTFAQLSSFLEEDYGCSDEAVRKYLYNREMKLLTINMKGNSFEVEYYNVESAELCLSKLAACNIVIGLSATADNESVLCNFDKNVLQRLQAPEHDLLRSRSDLIMKQKINRSRELYEKYGIKIKCHVSPDEYSDCYGNKNMMMTEPESACRRIVNDILDKLDIEPFCKKRYSDLIWAFTKFMLDTDVRSMLALETKMAKADDLQFNTKVIKELCQAVCKRLGIDWDTDNLQFITGEDYSSCVNCFREKLERGEKVFAVSCYATIGRGQNLQYKMPYNQEVFMTGEPAGSDDPRILYKDVDGIYLGQTTNLTTNFMNTEEKEIHTIIKALYDVEGAFCLGELNSIERRDEVENVINHMLNSNEEFYNKLYRSESLSIKMTVLINQAVGRICRTFMKGKSRLILINKEVASRVSIKELNRNILLPEMDAIREIYEEYQNRNCYKNAV